MPTAPSPTTTHLQTHIISHHPSSLSPDPAIRLPNLNVTSSSTSSSSCRSGGDHVEIRTLSLRRPLFRCWVAGHFSNLKRDCTSAGLFCILATLGLGACEGSTRARARTRGDERRRGGPGPPGPGQDMTLECSLRGSGLRNGTKGRCEGLQTD